jgi:hypothetical protein
MYEQQQLHVGQQQIPSLVSAHLDGNLRSSIDKLCYSQQVFKLPFFSIKRDNKDFLEP